MKRAGAALLRLLVLPLLYLLFWPVPVSPVAWDAPQDQGLSDPFEPNDRLALTRSVSIGEFEGPEDIACGADGYFYASTSSGQIIRVRHNGSSLGVFAHVGGRPLGLEFDDQGKLWVANAPLGLQIVNPDGTVENVVSKLDGQPVSYANDLAVASDGRVFFSDASSKFNPRTSGNSYESSLLDILEHGGHGRVLEYSPATDETRVIIEGLDFANGVAISDDQRYLLVNETGHYRVLRYWLDGPEAGSTEVILENLPGFPDNINNGLNGKYWIGLVAPRIELLDDLSGSPFLRKMLQRMPAFLRPEAVPSSHVIAIDGDGNVLMNLQDTSARFPALTGVCETDRSLYLTTLFGSEFGSLDKRDLGRR
jgi:hypothetical protein